MSRVRRSGAVPTPRDALSPIGSRRRSSRNAPQRHPQFPGSGQRPPRIGSRGAPRRSMHDQPTAHRSAASSRDRRFIGPIGLSTLGSALIPDIPLHAQKPTRHPGFTHNRPVGPSANCVASRTSFLNQYPISLEFKH